jgi:hypothetical protein
MSLNAARLFVASTVDEWRAIRLADLQYWHRGEAQLAIVGVFALIVLLLIMRSALVRRPGRHRLVVPAVLGSVRPSPLSVVRHIPLVLFLAGLPFLTLALADPFTSLVSSDVTYPGRRISVMIDASTSMRTPFKAEHLNRRAETDATANTAIWWRWSNSGTKRMW